MSVSHLEILDININMRMPVNHFAMYKVSSEMGGGQGWLVAHKIFSQETTSREKPNIVDIFLNLQLLSFCVPKFKHFNFMGLPYSTHIDLFGQSSKSSGTLHELGLFVCLTEGMDLSAAYH